MQTAFPDGVPDSMIADLPDRAVAKAMAAQWLTQMDKGSLCAVDQVAFDHWMAAHPRHREEFAAMSALWQSLAVLDELVPPAARAPAVSTNPTSVPASPKGAPTAQDPQAQGDDISRDVGAGLKVWGRGRLFGATIAGVATLMVVANLYLLSAVMLPVQEGIYQTATYQTARGEQQSVTLTDGSTILLNSDSQVRVRYTRQARDIELIKGEAHFDVVRSRARPFSVHAAEGVARAVGTAFTARRRPDDQLEVTVTEGAVALHPPARTGASSAMAAPHPQPIAAMDAGDWAIMTPHGVTERQALPADQVAQNLAWHRGFLSFEGAPLSTVLARFDRYTPIDVDLADPALSRVPIYGYFRIGDVAGLRRAVEATGVIDADQVGEASLRFALRGPQPEM